MDKQKIRLEVWKELKNVALPDSRFHLNFAEYIPDFKGSSKACDRIIKSEEYKKSKLLFITPDNCLTETREKAIKDGKDIIVVQIAGLVARRIVTEVSKDEIVDQGSRIGMIRFGSRADMYFEDYTPLVKVDQKTIAGETLIAKR